MLEIENSGSHKQQKNISKIRQFKNKFNLFQKEKELNKLTFQKFT